MGLALAKGENLKNILDGLGHVAEGVSTAPILLSMAKSKNIEVPITEAVCNLLEGKTNTKEALNSLMNRDIADEKL